MNLASLNLGYLTRQAPSILSSQNHKILIFSAQ